MKTTATERMRGMRGKKKEEEAVERMREKKNPEEREIIDKISSCSNILMQEIRLLMYSSSSHLMSYCSLEKKKKDFSKSVRSMNSGHFEHFFFYILPLYWLLEMLLELSPKKELLILKCLSMTYLFFVESLLKYNCT